MPTIDQLLQYLEKRQQLLEIIKGTSNTSSRSSSTFSKRSTLHKTMSHNCILCNKDHAQHKCEHFKIMKLCPGSKIQPDWRSFLFRWGKHRYVFIVDIEKMFQQINVAKNYRDFQRILQRKEPTHTERLQQRPLQFAQYNNWLTMKEKLYQSQRKY